MYLFVHKRARSMHGHIGKRWGGKMVKKKHVNEFRRMKTSCWNIMRYMYIGQQTGENKNKQRNQFCLNIYLSNKPLNIPFISVVFIFGRSGREIARWTWSPDHRLSARFFLFSFLHQDSKESKRK